MKYFEKQTLNTEDNHPSEVVATWKSSQVAKTSVLKTSSSLMTICRILLTPLLVWYRLYLWVWDGTMFDKHY